MVSMYVGDNWNNKVFVILQINGIYASNLQSKQQSVCKSVINGIDVSNGQ